MDVIRDDGIKMLVPTMWASADEFLDTVREQAGRLMLDRTAGQKTRLVVNCEAVGMGPQLARVTERFGIPIIPGGGFESTTAKHQFAAALASHDRPTEVLDIGDHDASGAHKFLNFAEDVQAFVRDLGGEVSFTPGTDFNDVVREFYV